MTAGSYIAIALVRTYQVVFSPVKGLFFGTGSCCRFTPTCSCYAIESFRAHGLLRGCQLTARRLLRCHPWGGAGYDPVPHAPAHPDPASAAVPPLNLSAHE